MADVAGAPPAFPGWECLEQIGAGGMSSVWRARQIAVDRIAALKVLDSSQARTDAEIDRFLSEARSIAALSHPGIVRVFDAFNASGRFCIAMELATGRPLSVIIRDNGPIPEQTALAIASAVADALDYAWSKERLVHCDIKPENLIVAQDASVKVTDFGISLSTRMISRRGGDDGETEICGTPAYMSPEQARACTELDPRTDMYALGATLFHALCGTSLFAGVPMDEIPERQISAETPWPRGVRLSAPVRRLLERLLAKAPEDRFADWQEAKRAIDLARQGRSFPGPSPDPETVSSPLPPSGMRLLRRRIVRALAPRFATTRARRICRLFLAVAAFCAVGSIAHAAWSATAAARWDRAARALSEGPDVGDRIRIDAFLSCPRANARPDLKARLSAAAQALDDAHEARLQTVSDFVRAGAAPLASAGDAAAAAAAVRGYAGPFAAATRGRRERIALSLERGTARE